MHPLVRWQYRSGLPEPRRPPGARAQGVASVANNALLKGEYGPVALPKREFMENAKAIWERLDLPPLKPETPWHGYDLGVWPKNFERQAAMAMRSEYFDSPTSSWRGVGAMSP